jgi:hypothetical protein
MIVISQVAGAARQLESERLEETKASIVRDSVFNWDFRGFEGVPDDEEQDIEDEVRAQVPNADAATPTDQGRYERAAYTRACRSSNKFKITQMLESWEEPQEEKNVVSSLGYVLVISCVFLG